MITEVLRVNGDYKIEAIDGNIIIDAITTSTTGTINILGNLNVVGDTVNFDTFDFRFKDNIVILNAGETNPYVTLGTSGIAISRGNSDSLSSSANILYDDNIYWGVTSTNHRGVFKLSVQNSGTSLQVNGLRIDEATAEYNSSGKKILSFLGANNPDAVLSVAGTTNYELNVLDDDDIPNKKYVDSISYFGTIYAKELASVGTTLRVQDPDAIPGDSSNRYWNTVPRIIGTLGTDTNKVLIIEGTQAQFYGLTLDNNIIKSVGTDTNLVLEANGTGTIVINSPLSLLNSIQPAPDIHSTIIYSTSTIGGGGTGLYFVNTTNQDEIISRKRALIYSIIF